MTITELKDDVLLPRFAAMEKSFAGMQEENEKQHAKLSASIDGACEETKRVTNRVFMTNGEPSLIESQRDTEAGLKAVRTKLKAHLNCKESHNRRCTDYPLTRRQKITSVGVEGAKYSAFASVVVALLHFLGKLV